MEDYVESLGFNNPSIVAGPLRHTEIPSGIYDVLVYKQPGRLYLWRRSDTLHGRVVIPNTPEEVAIREAYLEKEYV